MKLEDFLSLEISEKAKITAQKVELTKDPFWLERLKTAVQNHSPLAVCFNRDLVEEYWQIIAHK